MRKYLDLILVTIVVTVGAATLTYVDASGDRMNAGQQGSTSQQGTQDPKGAAGQFETPETTREKAVQKDRESSQHLGAGSGTSSGTGSGKMGSGSGPR